MSTTLPRSLVFEQLLRDLRHMEARAAGDLADWLVHLEAKGMADRSIYGYHRTLAVLLRSVPEKELAEITDTDIEAMLAHSPRQSRHITQSILRQFFKWAKTKRRIEENPMEYVTEIRKLPRRPKEIFTEAEVALLEGLPTPDGELFVMLFGTGLRRGEARNLRRSHIHLERSRLIVHDGKGSKSRIVPFTGSVRSAVADLDLYERLERDDFLWYTIRGNGRYRSRRSPIGNSTFDRWYRNAIERAGVRMLNPHQTRHTYGHLLRSKYDLEERKLLMGHDKIETTDRYYGHLTIEDVAAKMAALEAEA